MRHLYVTCLCLFAFSSQLTSQHDIAVNSRLAAIILNTNYDHGTPVIRHRCSNSLAVYPQPLFVVDGVPYDSLQLSSINPDDIASINILKDANAKAIFSCRPATGVVIVTTKKANERTIIVKDFQNNPLPGVTIEIISMTTQDTMRFVADIDGKLVTTKIVSGDEFELLISSIGYKPFRALVNSRTIGRSFTVLLEKDFKQMPGVVVTTGCSHCTIRCRIPSCFVHYCKLPDMMVKSEIKLSSFNIYPNPSKSGSHIRIDVKNTNAELQIDLINIQGQLISSSVINNYEKNSLLTYKLPNTIAGSYFLRITNNRSGKVQTEKLVIQ